MRTTGGGDLIGCKPLAGTDLTVSALCLGTNPFGWTAGEQDAFEVLDAFQAAGGNFLDTADSYSAWAEGNSGGESETVIGRWIARRGRSDDLVIATKVGSLEGGLAPDSIRRRLDESLRRLGVDRIDLYYAHKDDPDTPLEETLATFDELVRSGKVRHVGVSNYDAARLTEALEITRRERFTPLVAMTPHYNLLERGYEANLAPILAEHEMACVPYYGLAKGFLTGKYSRGDANPSGRGRLDGSIYANERGERVLEAVQGVAADHATTSASVALAWLAAQPTVLAPIASARTTSQLADLLQMADLKLSSDELERLDQVSAPEPTTAG
jgi:aryl-alcohol dehydrogenase-like predicted oxidoreductase